MHLEGIPSGIYHSSLDVLSKWDSNKMWRVEGSGYHVYVS